MTAATEPEIATEITLPARAAAIAWLNAFLAASTDEERPKLCRTLSIEFFPEGVQFVGCDGTALFRSWVPTDGEASWPENYEAPSHSVVVMDRDKFGVAYWRTLLSVTGAEEHESETVTLTVAPSDEGATLPLGADFMTERLNVRACGQRLDLLLYDGKYPAWRDLNLGMDAIERVDGLTVSNRLLGLIGKLKFVGAVDLEFFGETRHIAFRATGETEVRGLIMPMQRPVAAAS